MEHFSNTERHFVLYQPWICFPYGFAYCKHLIEIELYNMSFVCFHLTFVKDSSRIYHVPLLHFFSWSNNIPFHWYSALFIPSSLWGSFGLLLLSGYYIAVINIIANCMDVCLIVHWVQTETRTAVSHENSVVTFWRNSKLFSKVAAVFIISQIMSEDAKFNGSGFLTLLLPPPPPFPPPSWQGLSYSVIQAGLKLLSQPL